MPSDRQILDSIVTAIQDRRAERRSPISIQLGRAAEYAARSERRATLLSSFTPEHRFMGIPIRVVDGEDPWMIKVLCEGDPVERSPHTFGRFDFKSIVFDQTLEVAEILREETGFARNLRDFECPIHEFWDWYSGQESRGIVEVYAEQLIAYTQFSDCRLIGDLFYDQRRMFPDVRRPAWGERESIRVVKPVREAAAGDCLTQEFSPYSTPFMGRVIPRLWRLESAEIRPFSETGVRRPQLDMRDVRMPSPGFNSFFEDAIAVLDSAILDALRIPEGLICSSRFTLEQAQDWCVANSYAEPQQDAHGKWWAFPPGLSESCPEPINEYISEWISKTSSTPH